MNKPTDDQQKIIDADVSNMLVSAGAGCGKSSVLTARIIKRIKEGNLSIKNLIVLSFTNASANDIRKKIKDALKSELKDNERLRDEYDYVEQSNISTFDSLCHNLFKKYSYKLGLKSDINILDSTQNAFILDSIIRNVCDKYYDNLDFIKLLDITTIRDDNDFINALHSFYDSSVNNSVDSIELLHNMVGKTKNNLRKLNSEYSEVIYTIYGKGMKQIVSNGFQAPPDKIFNIFVNNEEISPNTKFYDLQYEENTIKIGWNKKLTTCYSMFKEFDISKIDFFYFDFSELLSTSYMFYRCSQLEEINFGSFDNSSLTDMSLMFVNCPKLTSLNLSSFTISKVKNLYNMFGYCSTIKIAIHPPDA